MENQFKESKPNLLIDSAKANARARRQADKPVFPKWGTFHAPKEISEGQMRQLGKAKIEQWLKIMDKQGFEYNSGLTTKGPFEAFDLDTQVILLDQWEWRIGGWFTAKKLKPMRIELPPDLIKREQDHILEATPDEVNRQIKRQGIKVLNTR